MKFEDALKAMRDGKKVRNGECKCSISLDEDKEQIVDFLGDRLRLGSCVLSDKWEVVE